jgi:hypothetical protein
MSISYIKIFNQLVDEFFRELIEIFPEETKLKVEYSLFQTLCATNCKKICSDFMNTCIPHLEKIIMKDEMFFIGDSKPSFLNRLNIDKLWNQLSITTKNAIWRYVSSFLAIGIHVINVSPESLILIQHIINS